MTAAAITLAGRRAVIWLCSPNAESIAGHSHIIAGGEVV